MLTFLLFTLLLFIKYHKNREVVKFITITYLLSLIIFSLKLMEYGYNITELMSGDEYYYYYGDSGQTTQRVLWIFINSIIRNYDIFGEIGSKLLNIPIGVITIIALGKVNNNKIPYSNYILFLPYLLVMFTLNLRDNLIIFFVIMTFKNIEDGLLKSYFLITIYIVLLFLLRPLFVILIFIIVIMGRIIRLKWAFLKSHRKAFVIVILLFMFLGNVFKDQISKVTQSFTYNIQYNYIDNYINSAKFTKYGDGYTGNISRDRIYGAFRYVFAPLPTSLISRLFSGTNPQGRVDDIFRIIHQMIYYYLLMYIILNIKHVKKVLSSFTYLQINVFLYLSAYMPIYSFYLFGSSHQRHKIPFQIAIFILYYYIMTDKKSSINKIKYEKT